MLSEHVRRYVTGPERLRHHLGRLTAGIHPSIMACMDTQAFSKPKGHVYGRQSVQPNSNKTQIVGVRLLTEQKDKLNKLYNGTASILARALFTKYFAGELPEVEAAYRAEIAQLLNTTK